MLDRLGRSVKNLVDLVGELHKQGIQFKSLTDAMDTGTPSGRFFFHIMASLAEMERELTVERTLQDWRLLANSAARVAENAR
jgi:DNA invertase Pin-like site-specific DNA recombinase